MGEADLIEQLVAPANGFGGFVGAKGSSYPLGGVVRQVQRVVNPPGAIIFPEVV